MNLIVDYTLGHKTEIEEMVPLLFSPDYLKGLLFLMEPLETAEGGGGLEGGGLLGWSLLLVLPLDARLFLAVSVASIVFATASTLLFGTREVLVTAELWPGEVTWRQNSPVSWSTVLSLMP